MTEEGGFRYDAFISYRHTAPDMGVAARLHRFLETYRLPRALIRAGAPARLRRVFRDREELPTSSDLGADLQQALRDSRCLIVVCSPRTPASAWIDTEVTTFLGLDRGAAILPLLVEGEPAGSLPRLLTGQPVAADLRGRRPLREAFLRLTASVAGCDPAELLRRDREHRLRRAALVAAGALALAAGFTGYTLKQLALANAALQEAQVQRDRAAAATQAAALETAAALDAEAAAQTQAALAEARRTAAAEQGALAAAAKSSAVSDESRLQAALSQRETADRRPVPGALLALEALPGNGAERPYLPEAEAALYSSLYAFPERLQLTGWTAKLQPGGRAVLHAGGDAVVFDVSTWRQLGSFPGPEYRIKGTGALVPDVSQAKEAVFSPDGRLIATGNWGNAARIFDATTGRELVRMEDDPIHDGTTAHLHFTPDGRRLVTAGTTVACVWDVATGQVLTRMGGHADLILQAELTPDGRFLITADRKTVRIWRVADGELLTAVAAKGFNLIPGGRYLVLSSAQTAGGTAMPDGLRIVAPPEERLAWSPDGRHALLLNRDHWSQTEIWDAETGQVSAVLAGAELSAYWGAFSPDGRQAVTALTNATAGVWDAASGRLLSELEAGPGPISQATFSPDGRLVAALFANDKTAGLWDASTGRLLAVLSINDQNTLSDFWFTPDSQALVIAAFDKITRVWYLEDRLRVVEPGPATGTGSSTALSPDGRRLATVATGGSSVRVQDTAAGAEITVLPAPPGDRIATVSFTPDDRWVVTETAAGAVIRWRCFGSTAELMAYARERMPRQLTTAERKRFLLE